MRFWRYLAAVLLLSFVAACSNQPECFVADTLKEIGVPTLNEKGVHIFLRTSGLSEKENFYEMYNSVPKFDDCGQSGSEPMSQVHVDTTSGFPQKLVISNSQLKIAYTADEGSRPMDKVSIVVE